MSEEAEKFKAEYNACWDRPATNKDVEIERLKAEIERLKKPWQPFSTVPPEALDIEVLDENGDIDEVSWRGERYCMLGRPQGSRGPGWISRHCSLPVDGPFTHWRPLS